MKGRVVMVLDRLPIVAAGIGDIVNRGTYVGIPDDRNQRTDEPVNNAALGYLHEHGEPASNIPARPWLVPGAKTVADKVGDVMKQGGRDALAGNRSAMTTALHSIGLLGVSAVRDYLMTGPFVPLSPVTIRERIRRRKYKVTQGIDRPLIDTGQMLRSVTYVIRQRTRAS